MSGIVCNNISTIFFINNQSRSSLESLGGNSIWKLTRRYNWIIRMADPGIAPIGRPIICKMTKTRIILIRDRNYHMNTIGYCITGAMSLPGSSKRKSIRPGQRPSICRIFRIRRIKSRFNIFYPSRFAIFTIRVLDPPVPV